MSDYSLIRRDSLYWVVGGLVLSSVPHFQRLPVWVMVGFLLMCGMRLFLPALLVFRKSKFFVAQLVFLPFMMLGLMGIYWHFGSIIGLNAGVALLVLSIGFKVLELEKTRDFYVVCFIGYFLIATNFFYSQTIATALYMVVNIFFITTGLVSFNDHGKRFSVASVMRLSATLLLQSVPVMLVFFLLFPRVQGPIWGMPHDAYSGLTGIDDEMSAGSVSHLIESDKMAFRVDFHGQQPKLEDLYWRGVVLWYSDGSVWKRGVPPDLLAAPVVAPENSAVAYTITLEPHNKKWLYALDMPGMAAVGSSLTRDFQLFTKQAVLERVRYKMTSYPQYRMQHLNVMERNRALHLPFNKHPKTKKLMQEWTQKFDQEQIITRALRLFNQENFYYTLRPPLLLGDRVDEFLFETKKGFCEHYASAFVVMMRAAGIPSRVVLGYHGGAYNPVGQYMMVQQKNAHAWAEVWRPGSGWQRIDPTTAIAPSRIMHDVVDNGLSGDVFNPPLVFGKSDFVRQFWQVLGYRWDVINNQWNQWVISYGPSRQRMFFEWLGFVDFSWLGVSLVAFALVSFVVVFFAFSMLRGLPKNKDVAVRLYERFCKKLSRIGIVREAHEGYVDFSERANKMRVDLAPEITDVTAAYVAVRYASDRSQISVLRRLVKKFKVR